MYDASRAVSSQYYTCSSEKGMCMYHVLLVGLRCSLHGAAWHLLTLEPSFTRMSPEAVPWLRTSFHAGYRWPPLALILTPQASVRHPLPQPPAHESPQHYVTRPRFKCKVREKATDGCKVLSTTARYDFNRWSRPPLEVRVRANQWS